MEEYKDIKLGYKNYTYRVYKNGTIKNINKNIFVATHTNRVGYKVLSVKNKIYLVHRLVAKLFIPNPNNYKYINHKDENKTNNNVENLEWCTNKYNSEYSVAKKVYQYDFNGNLINTYISTQKTYEYGYNGNQVARCCRNIRPTHKNYFWSYYELNKEEILNKYNKLRKHIRPVSYIDKNNNIIKVFNSVNEAAKYFKKDASVICRYIKNPKLFSNFYKLIYNN